MKPLDYSATTLDGLVETVRTCAHEFEGKALWYRGHASARHSLRPSLYRDRKVDAQEITENYLNQAFRLYAPMRCANVPSRDDTAGWLALMRHYGLPSRLLDWTESLLVAAFFAVGVETEPGPAVIWALAPERLNALSNGAGVATLSGYLRDSKIELTNMCDQDLGPTVAVMSEQVDLRMLMQQGTFTFHGAKTPLEDHPDAGSFMARIEIPEEWRVPLEARLHIAGIRRSSLYPDLANLAKDLASGDW